MNNASNDFMGAMKPFLLITDIGFISYWALSLPLLLGWDLLPGEWLFKDYKNPLVVAWNWSFFPLDMVLSICGLLGLRLYSTGHPAWRPMLSFSLALTFCAGFMALCYWIIRLDFDLSWWLPNAFIMLWPLYFLPKIYQSKAS